MELRKYKLYCTKNNTILVHGKQVGTICNIGKGGFCCKCIIDGKKVATPEHVDITCSEFAIKAFGLPIKVRSIHHQSGFILTSMKTRICHSEFQNLSETQKTQIDNLIHFLCR